MTNEKIEQIITELNRNAALLKEEQLASLIQAIRQANHIFLAGAGRSGIAIRAFANRLMHMGFSVSIVGEISSPHSQPGDLVIICSGSGETSSLTSLAEKAKQAKNTIALVTMKEASTIGGLSDVRLILPGTAKDETNRDEVPFSQPMGSAFEQLAFVIFDGIILSLMEELGETSASMFQRHADFE